ncbi:M48 family metalloprotease [bacterium]|nr:M48 family metalloprotease [bacterium]
MIYDQIATNKRNTFLLVFVFTIIIILACYFLGEVWTTGGGLLGIVIGAVISVGLFLISYFSGDSVLLSTVGAKEVDPNSSSQFYNVVKEMSISSGTAMPKVYIVPDPSPNAFAAGRDPEHASLAVNEGLLQLMNREELQGVIAHEMSHIQNRDILYATIVAVMAGVIVIIASFFRNSWAFGGSRRRNSDGGGAAIMFVIGLVFAIFAPIAAKLIQLAISRQREYLADASAAMMTRDPAGLASALKKLQTVSIKATTTNDAVAPLYFTEPRLHFNSASLFSTHPPIEERIARLERMAYIK